MDCVKLLKPTVNVVFAAFYLTFTAPINICKYEASLEKKSGSVKKAKKIRFRTPH